LDIYKPYVLESPISFEIEVPSVSELQERISETLKDFPWLVWEEDESILGYAYAGPFRTRKAYAWSAESTVYVRTGHYGNGIGKALYADLLFRLKKQGIVNVIGGIVLPNDASIALHEGFGFKKVAHLERIGFKLGRSWDVGYWQLQVSKP
jgi:phosphinothricin acetyltransferase